MSWITQNTMNFFQYAIIKILKSGRVPKHIAIIMDGNRSNAKKVGVERNEGHLRGYKKLGDMMSLFLLFGVQEVTVYAFSIENFKELSKRERLQENGICIRFIGNLSLVPKDVHEIMNELVRITKDNDKLVLNVAFSYTSRDEITNAVKVVVKGVKHDKLKISDINENLISKCLYTYKSEEPDLLIRTSGEVRFSDFLMWQTTHTCLYFTSVLWPEFSAWDLIYAVFYYQKCYNSLSKTRENCKKKILLNDRTRDFANKLYKERDSFLEEGEEKKRLE